MDLDEKKYVVPVVEECHKVLVLNLHISGGTHLVGTNTKYQRLYYCIVINLVPDGTSKW